MAADRGEARLDPDALRARLDKLKELRILPEDRPHPDPDYEGETESSG